MYIQEDENPESDMNVMCLYYTNTLSRVCSGETAIFTNFQVEVFCLTRPGFEPAYYHTRGRGEHANYNHYNTYYILIIFPDMVFITGVWGVYSLWLLIYEKGRNLRSGIIM